MVIDGSYFAPEYFMHGMVDEKTDVYAFGVLLLELITGRRALNNEGQSILLWVCLPSCPFSKQSIPYLDVVC